MSIDVMKRVWDNSAHGGPQLLLLLALADHADIDGVCWPGHPRLAKKTRVTPRQAIRLSKQLEESGEIFVLKGGGRSISNSYLITIGLAEDEIQTILVKHPRFGLSVDEAIQAAKEIRSKLSLGKGDIDDTVSTRKGDIDDTVSKNTKGDMQGQNSDMYDIKGDMQGQEKVSYMSPESSCNHQFNHQNNYQEDAPFFINESLPPHSHLDLEDKTVYFRESEQGELVQAIVKAVTPKRLKLNIGGVIKTVSPENKVFYLNGGPGLSPVITGESVAPALSQEVLALKNKLIDLTGAANITAEGPRIHLIKRCQDAAIHYDGQGITPQDLQDHYGWFRNDYWRGKQGDPYTLEILWSTWKPFIEQKQNGGYTNGQTSTGKSQSRANGKTGGSANITDSYLANNAESIDRKLKALHRS